MTAVSAEAAWLLLVGLAVVGAMVVLADGRLRWYPTGLLQWCMVVAVAQGLYGMFLVSGLIPQAEAPVVRIVMLPTWIAGVGFAVWKGRRAVLARWADRQLVRILGDLNVLSRITALHRRAEGAEVRELLLQEARTALGRRRGRAALLSFQKVLEQMEAEHYTSEEWSELRSRTRALVTNFVGGSKTSEATSAGMARSRDGEIGWVARAFRHLARAPRQTVPVPVRDGAADRATSWGAGKHLKTVAYSCFSVYCCSRKAGEARTPAEKPPDQQTAARGLVEEDDLTEVTGWISLEQPRTRTVLPLGPSAPTHATPTIVRTRCST